MTRRLLRLLAFATLSALLCVSGAACLLPDFEEPERDAGWRDRAGLAASEPVRPLVSSERETVNPARSPGALRDLVDLQRWARRSSPQARELSATLEAAEARLRQSLAAFYPALRTEGLYRRLEDEISFQDPTSGASIIVVDLDAYTQTTTLDYPVFDGGARRALHRASRSDRRRVEAEAERALETLDLRVAEAYYSILELEQDLEVARSSIATLEGALALIGRLRLAGRGTRADELVVEVELESRRLASRRLEDLLAGSRERLATSLGLAIDTRLLEGELVPDSPSEPPRALDCEALAVSERAEFRALRAAVRASDERRRAVEASYWPTVGVFLQHEYSTTDSAFRTANLFSGGVNLRWSLFEGFRTASQIRELEAAVRTLTSREEILEAEVRLEVRQALRAWRRAKDAVEVRARSILRARENLRAVTARYESAKATGQELLEAESLVRSEEARQVGARFGVLRARALLRYTVGLDLDEAEPAAAPVGSDSVPESEESER